MRPDGSLFKVSAVCFLSVMVDVFSVALNHMWNPSKLTYISTFGLLCVCCTLCSEKCYLFHRLAFRTLVRKYNCDICFTPMIVAADFMRSVKARDSEFTTNERQYQHCNTSYNSALQWCFVAPHKDGCVVKCELCTCCHVAINLRNDKILSFDCHCLFVLSLLRWPAPGGAVCCPWCPDSGRCSLCGGTFLRWSWPQLWLSPKVQLLTLGQFLSLVWLIYC